VPKRGIANEPRRCVEPMGIAQPHLAFLFGKAHHHFFIANGPHTTASYCDFRPPSSQPYALTRLTQVPSTTRQQKTREVFASPPRLSTFVWPQLVLQTCIHHLPASRICARRASHPMNHSATSRFRPNKPHLICSGTTHTVRQRRVFPCIRCLPFAWP
jgi:hypothetical protein